MVNKPHKPLLLFFGGLLCDARLWRDQVIDLDDMAHCAVADLTQDDTLAGMVDRAARDHDGPFALAALSMGGYAAFEMLRRHPGRVTRLCLMDTSARPETEASARRRRGLMALVRGGGRFRGVTPRLLPQLLHPANTADPDLGADVIGMADRLGAAVYLRQQTAILARPDSRTVLPTIAVPTLVAVGEADQLTPHDLAAEIAGGVPGARLRVVAGAGHLPPMEQPGTVSRMLREWLAAPMPAERSCTP